MSFLTGKERREAEAEAAREEERVEQSASLYWRKRAEEAEGVLEQTVQQVVALKEERDAAIQTGKQFEQDARKHFDQSCRNLQRAEWAEALLQKIRELLR